jgi:hypothetical protein
MTQRKRKAVELGAVCATCDNGERKSLMAKGETYCRNKNKRVHLNAVCEEYSHLGVSLMQITRRARTENPVVVQPTLFDL